MEELAPSCLVAPLASPLSSALGSPHPTTDVPKQTSYLLRLCQERCFHLHLTVSAPGTREVGPAFPDFVDSARNVVDSGTELLAPLDCSSGCGGQLGQGGPAWFLRCCLLARGFRWEGVWDPSLLWCPGHQEKLLSFPSPVGIKLSAVTVPCVSHIPAGVPWAFPECALVLVSGARTHTHTHSVHFPPQADPPSSLSPNTYTHPSAHTSAYTFYVHTSLHASSFETYNSCHTPPSACYPSLHTARDHIAALPLPHTQRQPAVAPGCP